MAQTLSNDIRAALNRDVPAAASGDVLVAFSGGLDSTVLLEALADSGRRVRAVHVNHQLHPDAGRWLAHCEASARTLRIEFSAQTVEVPVDLDEGVESAARRVRYDALRAMLRPDETLLTAHHADDQLETVLLALMRGSGVDGLAAMPRCQRFGAGWHVRPLLSFTRDELGAWAHEHNLEWLDDPSNDSTRFDRNYLRAAVVPRLRERWPSAARAAVRTAAHLGEAARLLDDMAAHDFAAATLGACLSVAALESLEPARRRNLLRYWLHSCGARAPSTRKLAALEHDMLCADDDRTPCVAWGEVEVRRHRGLLYCTPRVPDRVEGDIAWSWATPVVLASGSGLLRAEIAHGRGLARAKLPEKLTIGARRGGEWLRLPGHRHRRQLKKLLQEANVLPWWRDRLPLVFAGEALVAVADLWISAEFAASEGEAGVCIVWDERPPIEAQKSSR